MEVYRPGRYLIFFLVKFPVECCQNHVWEPIFDPSYDHIYKNIHFCKGKGRQAREGKGREAEGREEGKEGGREEGRKGGREEVRKGGREDRPNINP